MSDRWAACFPRSSLHAALPLRLRSDVKACEEGDIIWVHGTTAFEEIDPLLRQIPEIIRYRLGADTTLTRIDRRIPERSLPTANWSPFSTLAALHPQPAALPAGLRGRVSVRIVRSSQPEEPSALICSIQSWADYAATAPQVRLDRLRFAVRADGQTLILGSPLPPIRGSYFVDRVGLLLPNGYAWEPSFEPQILRRAMNLPGNDLALFNLDGSYELIPAESFVAASRSAARRSLAALIETAGAT